LNAPSASIVGSLTSSIVQAGRVILSSNLNGTAGFFTGALSAASLTITGALSAVSATFTGALSAGALSATSLTVGSTTLTGPLTATSASFSGSLSANSLSISGNNAILQVPTIRASGGSITSLGVDQLIVNSYLCAPLYSNNIDITGVIGNYTLNAMFISNGVLIFEDFGIRARTDTLNITMPDSSQFVNGTYVDIVNATFMNLTVNNRTTINSEVNSKNNYARIAVMTVHNLSTWMQIGG
jgi:hypothetical protein